MVKHGPATGLQESPTKSASSPASGATDQEGGVQGGDGTALDSEGRSPRRVWVVATVALAVVLGAALWSSRERDPVDVAMETADRFFEVFNDRDVDRLTSLLSSDLTGLRLLLREQGGTEVSLTGSSPHTLRDLLFWASTGATFEDTSCEARETGGPTTDVVCNSIITDPLRAAVGASSVETETSFTWVDGTMEGFELLFIDPRQGVAPGFMSWLESEHPGDFAVIARAPFVTEGGAIAAGEARARHIDEYAAYLEENGCPASGC